MELQRLIVQVHSAQYSGAGIGPLNKHDGQVHSAEDE